MLTLSGVVFTVLTTHYREVLVSKLFAAGARTATRYEVGYVLPSDHHLIGDAYFNMIPHTPSVAVHRLRNAPPADETTNTVFCDACGSDHVTETPEFYRGRDRTREGAYRTRCVCQAKDCGEEWIKEEA